MSRRLTVLAVLLLVADLLYSAWQHYHGVLDGDMASIVLPAERYRQILSDPFGFGVILRGEQYGGANRYFAHAAMATWFRTVPFAFQWAVSPLTSVYLSCALIKVLTQAYLIWLLAVYTSGSLRIRNAAFLWAALLVTPFFQTTGFDGAMSLIDASPTYVFFYALGFALLLTIFLPLYLTWRKGAAVSPQTLVITGLLAVPVVFNGPLNVPVLLLAVLAVFIVHMAAILGRRGFQPTRNVSPVSRGILMLASWCLILCIYSNYIGRANAENFWNDTVSLAERFRRLPRGIFEFFIGIKGCMLLLVLVAMNAVLLLQLRREARSRSMLRLLGWISLFCLVYLLLLPLGGYRPYRPNIVKKDLALPVLMALMLFWALSSSWLLQYYRQRARFAYSAAVIAPLLLLTLADGPGRGRDYCQKLAILRLRSASGPLVTLPMDCTVLTWEPVAQPDDSKTAVDMLRYWRVLDADKRFIQR